MSKGRTTPGDYLPIARELMAHRAAVEAADEERNVAERDQEQAAAREAHRLSQQTLDAVEAAGIEIQHVSLRAPDERSLAWTLAVTGAIGRRIPEDRRCAHATPDARRPVTALLTSRLMFCRDCRQRIAALAGPAALAGRPEDDGLCDVCDRPNTQFSEFSGTFGRLRVIGNACPACRFWLDGLARQEN
jgi:hypothetical protein